MRICANLSLLFTELPLEQRIAAAARAGFDGVEIQFPYALAPAELNDALQAARMPLRLFNLPAGDLMEGGAGLAAVPAQRGAFSEALDLALAYAEQVRPAYVNVLPGRLAPGVTREEALDCLADNLRRSAAAFERMGVGVLCEAINPLDSPGFLVCSAEDLDALLAQVDHANLSAQLDLYHMARQGIDPVAAIQTLGRRIGHVQFADCPGRAEPGTGQLDFSAALQALQALGYRGWLGAEYHPTSPGEGSLGWLAQWRTRLVG